MYRLTYQQISKQHSAVLLTKTPKRVRIHPTLAAPSLSRDKRINMESINRYVMSLVSPLVAAGVDIANGNITKMFFFAKYDMFVPNCAVAYCMCQQRNIKPLISLKI